MLFITNKYTTWYNSIIQSAVNRILPKTIYTERHHIIPRSLGGDNSSANLVRLTAREHFICHLLLTKMTSGIAKSKMAMAAWMFASASKNQQRHKMTNRQYEKLKLNVSAAKKGEVSKKKGKKVTDSIQLANIKIGAENREAKYASGELVRVVHGPCSAKTLAKFSENAKNNPKFTTKGYKHSEETKEKIGAANSKPRGPNKIPTARACCMCCKLELNINNLKRWHGANCEKTKLAIEQKRLVAEQKRLNASQHSKKTTKGYKHSAETKLKLSIIAAARPKGPRKVSLPLVSCVCCRKIITINNINNHYNSCKNK